MIPLPSLPSPRTYFHHHHADCEGLGRCSFLHIICTFNCMDCPGCIFACHHALTPRVLTRFQDADGSFTDFVPGLKSTAERFSISNSFIIDCDPEDGEKVIVCARLWARPGDPSWSGAWVFFFLAGFWTLSTSLYWQFFSYVNFVWIVFVASGDTSFLAESYPAMQRF